MNVIPARTHFIRNASDPDIIALVKESDGHDAGLVKGIIVLSTFLMLIGTTFVLARVYVRLRILRRFFIDDCFIVLAMLLGIAAYGTWMEGNTMYSELERMIFTKKFPFKGKVNNKFNLDYHTARRAMALTVMLTMFHATASRISILCTFSRLSISQDIKTRNVKWVMRVAAVLMVLAGIVVTWLSVDPCWPPTGGVFAAKTKPQASRHCFKSIFGIPEKFSVFLLPAIFSAIMDFFIFMLPFCIFKWAGIPYEHRRALYGLFAFGFVVFFISVLRVIEAGIEVRVGNLALTGGYTFGMAEASFVMIGACLPTLKPLWDRFRGWRYQRYEERTKVNEGTQVQQSNV